MSSLWRNFASFVSDCIFKTAVSSESEHSGRLEWNLSLLRKFPFWVNGHRIAGHLALELKRLELAYASACAIKQLAPELPDSALIFAKCYVYAGRTDKAHEILIELKSRNLSTRLSHIVSEELAAVLISLGDYHGARTALLEIPSEKRTSVAQVALEYTESRLSGAIIER